jgi:hypothetical protein
MSESSWIIFLGISVLYDQSQIVCPDPFSSLPTQTDCNQLTSFAFLHEGHFSPLCIDFFATQSMLPTSDDSVLPIPLLDLFRCDQNTHTILSRHRLFDRY